MKKVFEETSKYFTTVAKLFESYKRKPLLISSGSNDFTAASQSDKKKPQAQEETKQNKRKKAPKDPNAPKKPLTAFMLYTNHRRPQLLKSNPSKPADL